MVFGFEARALVTIVMTQAFLSILRTASKQASPRWAARALSTSCSSRHFATRVSPLVASQLPHSNLYGNFRLFASGTSVQEEVDEDLDTALDGLFTDSGAFEAGEKNHIKGSHPMPKVLVEKVSFILDSRRNLVREIH